MHPASSASMVKCAFLEPGRLQRLMPTHVARSGRLYIRDSLLLHDLEEDVSNAHHAGWQFTASFDDCTDATTAHAASFHQQPGLSLDSPALLNDEVSRLLPERLQRVLTACLGDQVVKQHARVALIALASVWIVETEDSLFGLTRREDLDAPSRQVGCLVRTCDTATRRVQGDVFDWYVYQAGNDGMSRLMRRLRREGNFTNLSQVFPQLAVAIGGAMPIMPEQR